MTRKIRLRLVGWISLCGFVALALAGCAGVDSKSSEEPPSYPVTSVNDPKQSFDSFDRQRAIRAYRRERGHMLFELAINRNGDVVRLKVIRTELDEYMSAGFKAHVLAMKFSPAPDSDPQPYRLLFYPLSTKANLTIDMEPR